MSHEVKLLPCGQCVEVVQRLIEAGLLHFTDEGWTFDPKIWDAPRIATRPTVLPCDDELVERVAETIADFLDERFPQGAMPGGQQLFATDHLDAEFNHEAGCEELARTILAAIEAGGAVAATSGETPNPGPVTGEGQGWQPIESAPRYRWLLVAEAPWEPGPYDAYAAHWHEDGYWMARCGQYVTESPDPTHWRELPEPPAQPELNQ